MDSQSIPVIILAGFLGAGKTTLLNHILRTSNGKRIGVIVNDFGEVNIDSLLVSKQTDSTIELSGGCICCQMGEGGLDETLATFAHPGSTIDAVIIEASGIAEPLDLRKLILYSSNKSITMNGVVYVVDAGNILEQLQNYPQLQNHIASADLLILNKIDLVDEAKLENIKAKLTKLNPQAAITQVTDGEVSPELLFDIESIDNASEPEQLSLASNANSSSHPHSHLHDKFTSVSFNTKKPLSPKLFENFLNNLPANVYRLKGIIYYGMKGFEQKIIIHKVGTHIRQTAEEWHAHETPSSKIIAIGVDIDESELTAKLNACIDPQPDNITSDDMVDIMRLKGF